MPVKVRLVGNDGLLRREDGALDLDGGRLQHCMRLYYVLGHLGLGGGKVDRRFLLFREPLTDERMIARAHVLQGPHHADVRVEPTIVDVLAVIRAAAEDAAIVETARPGTLHDHRGQPGAKMLLSNPFGACRHCRPLRG